MSITVTGCFVINLDKSTSRWQHMLREFERLGCAVPTRISATDGRGWSDEKGEWDPVQKRDLIQKNIITEEMGPIHAAVGYSHIRALTRILEENHEWAAVFEDDIEFLPGVDKEMILHPEPPPGADVLWLHDNYHHPSRPSYVDTKWVSSYKGAGMFGYIVSRVGAQKLLRCMQPMAFPQDIQIMQYFVDGESPKEKLLNTYTPFRPLIGEISSVLGGSDKLGTRTEDTLEVRGPTEKGFNIVGWVSGAFGLAQNSRLIAALLESLGIPHVLIDWTLLCSHSKIYGRFCPKMKHESTSEVTSLEQAVYDKTIWCCNGKYLMRKFAAEPLLRAFIQHRYNIGYWAYELEWVTPFETVAQKACGLDEIWSVSEFSARALRPLVACPVRHVLLPPKIPSLPTTVASSSIVNFLFIYSMSSGTDRKNPFAVIEAFKMAFADTDFPVRLTIKTTPPLFTGKTYCSLIDTARLSDFERNRIRVVCGDYNESQMERLWHDSCDVYVSLHRAEGYGLTMVEAMARGKPVIATAYSANLEYMTHEKDAILIPYTPINVKDTPAHYDVPTYALALRTAPHPLFWASPDIAVASEWMKKMYLNPDLRASIGSAAREKMIALKKEIKV